MDRRKFLWGSFGSGLGLSLSSMFSSCRNSSEERTSHELPISFAEQFFPVPVLIEKIEILQVEKEVFVITTSKDGASGIVQGNARIFNTLTIFKTIIIPFFLGKDARQIVSLVEEVYKVDSNYKLAGIPFWNAVGHVELSILDMLAKMAGKKVAELFGPVLRNEIPVYLSSLSRDTTPKEEVDWMSKRIAETGAKAVKLKMGGRMSKNADSMPGRTEELVPLARKVFGEELSIYFDSNGSYDVPYAIRMGKLLEKYNIGFYEEPVSWQDFEGTRKVAEALKIPVAGGEQDTNLFLFNYMIHHKGFDLVQPDLFYNGGFIRCLQVAEMARVAGISIAPHSPKNNAVGAANLQFASLVENTGPHQEFYAKPAPRESWYAPYFEVANGKIKLPEFPGLGVEFDPEFLKKGVLL